MVCLTSPKLGSRSQVASSMLSRRLISIMMACTFGSRR
jgi:hypothetical protein